MRKRTLPLKREGLSEQVVTEIAEWILTGKVQPGDTLPSETELSRHFEVSKAVVREAGKVLASKGLVTIRQGVGTTVNPRDQWRTVDPLFLLHDEQGASFESLIRLREIIEPEVAAMACARSDDAEFRQLLEELIVKGGPDTSVEDHATYDLAFHQALAEATGNQYLVIMMNSIGQFLRAIRVALFEVPGAVGRSTAFHQEIVDAIAAGDPDASRDAMRRHLQQVRDDYQRLKELQRQPD